MVLIRMLDGTYHCCSVIEFTSDGKQLVADEGEKILDLMKVVRIMAL